MWSSVVALVVLVAAGLAAVRWDSQWWLIGTAAAIAAAFAFLISGAAPDGRWFRAVEWLVPRMASWMLVVCLLMTVLTLTFAVALLFLADASLWGAASAAGISVGFIAMSVAFTRSPVSIDEPEGALWNSSLPDATARFVALALTFAALGYLARTEVLDYAPAVSTCVAILGLGGLGFLRALARRRRALTSVCVAADALVSTLFAPTDDARSVVEQGMALDRALRTGVDSGLSPLRVPCGSPRTSATLLAYVSVLAQEPGIAQAKDRVVDLVRKDLLRSHRDTVRRELLGLVLTIRHQSKRYVDATL